MLLDIGVKDLINIQSQKISYNDVILTRQDIIKIPQLMQYFSEQLIHFDKELRLDTLLITQQNEIGLIFFEYYQYIIIKDNIKYLNKSKLIDMFKESEVIIGILNRVEKIRPPAVENTYVIEGFSLKNLNLIILNWFHNNYRNFRSIKKNIIQTISLYDININQGYYNKIVDPSEFIGLMFNRFVRIQKGSIPFSSEFGSSIKESIQTKSNYFTKKHILEEITDFTNTLTNIYNEDFSLVDIQYKETVGLSVSLQIMVTIQINKNEVLKFVLK